MSTGPGPTRKADGSAEASVDDIADLLVEDESHQGRIEGEQSLDDGLDVMLETPGPALVSTFMPPPPAPPPVEGVAEDAEESESAEEPGEATNLAYEDLLAKLVLPAKAPEPEPAMPALASSLPLPESITAPAAPTPPAVSFRRPSSPSLQVAPPSDERTLVTVNPLLAEEQEAAAREGRAGSREQPPIMVQEEMRPALTEPMAALNGAKSRLFYLMAGGLLVLGGFVLAVVLLKLIMPTPAPPPPVVIAPAPLPPPPPAAHVEPLPPSVPPAAIPPAAPAAPEATAPAATPPSEAPIPGAEEAAAAEVEKTPPKAHKPATHKVAHVAAPKPAPKSAVAPKVAPTQAAAPAAKAPKAPAGKKPKSGGYADPFDN
jgi:hypothetical protein